MANLDFPVLEPEFVVELERRYIIGEEEAAGIRAIIRAWGEEIIQPGSTIDSDRADLRRRVLTYLSAPPHEP